MRTGTPATRLIVLRGNSASGKSATAAELRRRFGHGLALVGQDNLRRVILRERDHPGAANIGLIDTVTRYTLDAGYHVVLEGILYVDHYGDMLQQLRKDHRGPTHCYYLDVPFEETLARHATKAEAAQYGEHEMHGWYRPLDLLPNVDETVIGPDSTLTQTVDRIMLDTGLAIEDTVSLTGWPDQPTPAPPPRSAPGTQELVELTGGRMTPGVVRDGDTVRRPATPASPFVASLLRLLEARGFDGAPRYLRREGTTDVLTYMPGDVPARFRTWSNEQVAAAGALLRALHDATRGSTLAGRHPVVCHHDPGPNNMTFLNGMPTAFIDFDTAAPGSALEDIGYMAWTWCIAAKPTAPTVQKQAAQVRLLADAYRLEAAGRAALVDAILERQIRNARFWAEQPPADRTGASASTIASRIQWSRLAHAFVHTHRQTFDQALNAPA